MDIGHNIAKLAGRLLRPVRAGDEKLAEAKEGAPMRLGVTTTAFVDGGVIPDRHADESGAAPSLSWSGVPPGAQELAVLCEDPDAPFPKPYAHWVVYALPPAARSLPDGLSLEGVLQGKNSSGTLGFTGPKPPPGHGVHHYHFQVFALDARLDLPPGADRDALVKAMHGRVLAIGEVVGTFEAT